MERDSEKENASRHSNIVNTIENLQGDGQKVKKIINTFEKKMKESIINVKESNHNNSPSRKFQRKGKIDVLRRLEMQPIKKADSPTKRKKTQSTAKKKISDEAILKESLSLTCTVKKGEKVNSIQQTLWDIWGQETGKKGALN